MFITDVLSNGMSMQEFALRFQQGHHQKRQGKNGLDREDDAESSHESDDDAPLSKPGATGAIDATSATRATGLASTATGTGEDRKPAQKARRTPSTLVSKEQTTESPSHSLWEYVKPSPERPSTSKRKKLK